MDVLVVGGHGQVALRLLKLLAQRGDRARGLIRKSEHAPDLETVGAIPVLGDLERDESLAEYVRGADGVVFAAGAGPGSGPERKWTMDYGGAVKLIGAAKRNGIARYVIVSSMGADPDAPGDDVFAVYLRAKGKADADLRESGLEYTIIRPGGLTNDAGTGR